MPVIIQAFSDYVCPYCYLGQIALNRAAATTGAEIVWRAFQLQTNDAPKSEVGEERRNAGWETFVYPMAQALKAEIRKPSQSPLSRLAHEAAAWARTLGRFDQFHQQLFNAYFLDDKDISEPSVLKEIAWRAGLNPAELEKVLTEHRMADDVEEDLLIAETYGVKIVPTFVVGGHLFSGVQEEAVLIKAIELARDGKLEAETRKLPHLPVKITGR